MSEPKKIKRLTVDIPELLHKELKIASINRDLSMNELIRQLIVNELAGKKSKTGRASKSPKK